MLTLSPGQTNTTIQSGLPTGVSVGVKIVNAMTELVASARTTTGVTEVPAGSGNYVIAFTAPAESSTYLLVIDWSEGVYSPTTTRVEELLVTAQAVIGDTSMGAVADYCRMYLGAATWAMLEGKPDFGQPEISRTIAVVKRRVFMVPPEVGAEAGLDPLVLDYLGLLTAISLIPAARDGWGDSYIQRTIGNDPAESEAFVNRAALMDDLLADLRSRVLAAQALAVPLIEEFRATPEGSLPEIDECDEWPFHSHVTNDPRHFPPERDFPYEERVLAAQGLLPDRDWRGSI